MTAPPLFRSPPRTRTPARPGPTRGSGPSASWVGFCASIGGLVIAGVMQWGPQIVELVPEGSARDRIAGYAQRAHELAAPVWRIGAVLVAVTAVIAAIAAAFRGQRDRVGEAVNTVTRVPAAKPGRTVTLRRTPWGRPRRVQLVLPADFASEDPAERARVEAAVTRVLGRGQWRGEWNERKLRKGKVALRRIKTAVTESDDAVREDRERVQIVARKIFGPQAEVTSTKSDAEGRLERFSLTYTPHPRLASETFREAVAESVTQLLPGVWEVRWDLRSDALTAERRDELTPTVLYQLRPITPATQWRLPVAQVSGQLEPAAWNLEGKTPHSLVTGETGGGKTYAFLNLGIEALRRGIPVMGVDPKMVELMAFEGWPGFEKLATEPAEMVEVITYLHDLMMYRYKLIRSRQMRRSDLWPIVAFLDEMLIMQEVLNDYWAVFKAETGTKGGTQHPAIRLIIRMAALARTARIHLAVGVQRPQATLFPEGARDNFRFRLSLGSLSQEGAMQMWGDAQIGTRVPSDMPGRGTVSTSSGPREAQVFKIPELDLTAFPDDALPADQADLRRRLFQECQDALAKRPENPVLNIGSMVLSKAAPAPADAAPAGDPVTLVEDQSAAADPVAMPVMGLGEGDLIQAPDPDDDDAWVQATVEAVSDSDDEGRVLLDYRTADGRGGQWDLDESDEVQLLG